MNPNRFRQTPYLRLFLSVLILGSGLTWYVIVQAFLHSTHEAPAPTLLVLDRHGEYLCEIGDSENSELGYWLIEEVPERVAAAIIAIEDHRFRYHWGVDPIAILRAWLNNYRHGRRTSGASTLAMQIVRMQHPAARTYWRKLTESLSAVLMTLRYGRDEVLKQYLKITPYSNRIRGIGYAARRYLQKPIADLSWAEIAFLASLPQSPTGMNPYTPEGRLRAIKRARRILAYLQENDELTRAEYELALAQVSNLHFPPRNARPDDAMHLIMRLELLCKDPNVRRNLAAEPILRCSVDLQLQREVAWKTMLLVDSFKARGAGNAAVMIVDNDSNEIISYVGSTDYFDDVHAGSIDYCQVPRSAGSTLKPFFYALALELGLLTPASILDDLQRGAGGIGNYDERFLGPLLPRLALANSRNVPAANVVAMLGVDRAYGFLYDLGLHDYLLPARHYGLGMAIGNLPVSLEQLVKAYSVFAGDGKLRDLSLIKKASESNLTPKTTTQDALQSGNTAGARGPERTKMTCQFPGLTSEHAFPRRIISEDVARIVSLYLSDPLARLPTFPRMGPSEFPFPVAIKTGTSSNYHDAWTMAYSTRYLVGIWLGRPDYLPMNRLSGHTSAARLAKEIMNYLHAEQRTGFHDLGFPTPQGYRAVRLCPLSGKRITPACPNVVVEWFRPGEEPVDACDVHVNLPVDSKTGAVPRERNSTGDVTVKTFVKLHPRYADWAISNRLPFTSSVSLTDAAINEQAQPEAALPFPQGSSRDKRTSKSAYDLAIVSPVHGTKLLHDPETPAALSSVALQAIINPPIEQAVWYVDGEPYQTVPFPYSTRWPLNPGIHTFQIGVPFSNVKSPKVEILVH